MIYENIPANTPVNIDRILFVHIRDYGEQPDPAPAVREGDFWELLYVEKGLINIESPSFSHTLSKTGLCFRHPSETIRLCMHSPAPAKLICIGFCTGPSGFQNTEAYFPLPSGSRLLSGVSASATAMDLLRGRILPVSPPEHRLLHHIITESASCGTAAPFAAGQAAMLYFQLLLILLLRNIHADITLTSASRSVKLEEDDELFRSLVEYMEEHIADHLTIEKICRDNLLGRAPLQKLFTDYTGCGVIDYFLLMKINAAKQLIRDGKGNLSQISEQLGYSSIHYFSRQFKKITGITPSEYLAHAALR